MNKEDIKKALECCNSSGPYACNNCPYYYYAEGCRDGLIDASANLINEQEKEIEQLKTALNWYINMYGCRTERIVNDDNVEYSCNGYIADEEEAVALLKTKRMLDWFC